MRRGGGRETIRARAPRGLLLALLAGGLQEGCSPHLRPAVGPEVLGRGTVSDGGSCYVVYRPSPDPIPFNRPFELVVTVLDERDRSRPAPVAEVDVRATMPAHGHGMNLVPRVAAAGPGRFLVEGMLFHMPGLWRLEIEAQNGGGPERARFDIELE